jgi:hypothetical protein
MATENRVIKNEKGRPRHATIKSARARAQQQWTHKIIVGWKMKKENNKK